MDLNEKGKSLVEWRHNDILVKDFVGWVQRGMK
jgi:hypothetical protein